MTSSVTQLLCSCQFLLGAREVIPEFVSVFRTCADKHCLASYPIFFLEGMKLCSWTTVCISAGGKCRICLRQFGFCMALLVSCGTSSLATLTSRIPGLTSGRYRPSIYVAWKIWKKKSPSPPESENVFAAICGDQLFPWLAIVMIYLKDHTQKPVPQLNCGSILRT